MWALSEKPNPQWVGPTLGMDSCIAQKKSKDSDF